ncbi:MAG: response regulator, partial [Deltaproteobacteria bacterium]|nr:response regulator [Deltaproteobacteria bacterium]
MSSTRDAMVKVRVLVVEDSRTQALALRLMLERAGYEVETAGDGIEALEILRQRSFETVISDLRMPRMDGH